MLDGLIKTLVGDLDEKRAYRKTMRRANALPKEYRYAFRKMRSYMFTVGVADGNRSGAIDLALFSDLIDLLESSADRHRTVLELIGGDVGAFCDALLRASANDEAAQRQRWNQAIPDSIPKENTPC